MEIFKKILLAVAFTFFIPTFVLPIIGFGLYGDGELSNPVMAQTIFLIVFALMVLFLGYISYKKIFKRSIEDINRSIGIRYKWVEFVLYLTILIILVSSAVRVFFPEYYAQSLFIYFF